MILRLLPILGITFIDILGFSILIPLLPFLVKKSIAAFKLREGMNIGAKVTLRGDRMYTFLDKLFNIVLPRIRDFRGLNRKSFDGRGNYNLGLREQLVFPEIDFDKVEKARGMDIVIVTTAKNDEEATEFLTQMGLPLQKPAGTAGAPR